MNSQVYLNPTPLSIISIPRDKVWLFSAPILRLLSQEADRCPQTDFLETKEESESESLEEDDFHDDDSFHALSLSDNDSDAMASSHISGGLALRESPLSRLRSKTDNSSKSDPLAGSFESISELASPVGKAASDTDENDDDENYFFHIAYNPSECTVMCAALEFSRLFEAPLAACKQLGYHDVEVLPEQFLNLQVDSEGEFNTSARILELTKPLSQHNISLFFLSSHFTDIVLIPHRFKKQVINILTKKNFEFSDISNSYIINRNLEIESLLSASEEDSDSPKDDNKTMQWFDQANIVPHIQKKVKLLLTGARPRRVKHCLLKASQCIASQDVPDYFSITRTSLNEVSLILPGSTRKRSTMGFDFQNIIGSAMDTIIPITVDLSELPLDSAGIVAGLASSLVDSMKSLQEPVSGRFEMNYLSMARSGIIMIPKENLKVVTKVVENMKYGTKE